MLISVALMRGILHIVSATAQKEVNVNYKSKPLLKTSKAQLTSSDEMRQCVASQ